MAMIPFAGVSMRPAGAVGLVWGTRVLRPARAQREGIETQGLVRRGSAIRPVFGCFHGEGRVLRRRSGVR